MYYDVHPNSRLQEYVKEYSQLLESRGEAPVTITRMEAVEDVLKESDVRPTLECFHMCFYHLMPERGILPERWIPCCLKYPEATATYPARDLSRPIHM